MPNKLFVVFTFTSVFILPTVSKNKDNQPSISDSVNYFGLKLLKELSDGKSNVFQSPMSIVAAMTMAMLGAKGTTYIEIYKTMKYKKDKKTIKREWETVMKTVGNGKEPNVLAVANKMLAKKDASILNEFKKQLKSFDAEIEMIEGDIVKSVNDWVNKKTRGMIPTLIDEPQPYALLILVNAIYFQGYWQVPMKKEETNDEGIFYNHGKTKKKLAMMHQQLHTEFSKVKDLGGFKMLELAYKESKSQKFKMLLLLPNSYTGLKKLVDKLTIDKLKKHRKSMKNQEVNVDLPRFNVSTEYFLENNLPKMGIVKAFNHADFSGIAREPRLKISSVIHKAVIQVDEAGTKAAAATAVIINVGESFPMKPPDPPEIFNADHPFLFFIIDDITAMIMFCGTVNAL